MERIKSQKTVLTKVLTGQPSGNISKKPEERWSDLMDYTDEIQEFLENTIKRKLQELESIEQAINDLRPREQAILTARYILGLEFNEILRKFPVSERSLYRIHHEAIEHINMEPLDSL